MRLLSFLLAALLVPAASAQVGRGIQEISGSGSFTGSDGVSVLSLNLSYGYFVTRNVELGPTLSLVRFGGDDDSATSGIIGAFGHLHFGRRGATTVPFLGAEVGAAVGSDLGPGSGDVSIGVVAGGKFFIARGAALTPLAFFQFDDNGNSLYGARFGVSAFF